MTNEQIIQFLKETPAAVEWEKVGIRQHHGINLPLFSLHSQTSCGIGEYLDLIPLIQWCKEIGFDIIQLLPLNDTGIDTSPYSALSANALNPIHLSLMHLPFVAENQELIRQIEALFDLNRSQRIVYPEVQKGKENILRLYYQKYKAHYLNSQEYLSFKKSHPWLNSYALFKALKIHYAWKSWEEWPDPWKKDPQHQKSEISKELQEEIEYHLFIQYLCFQQMEHVKETATRAGIFIKGDIPILINRESADTWHDRNLFFLDLVAGAPPDMYSEEGQKWGFPLYNWDALENLHYDWWINRLKVATHFYHIYRIDHIVGFYRIWAIPLESLSKEGYFFPQDKTTWIAHGEKIMRMMLANCNMLPIGEDLGTVPPEVRINLRSLGICGTKVMRWERRWDTDKGFIDPKDYPPESMTTVSTHDSETLQLWWQNQPEEATLYAKTMGWAYDPQLTQEQRLAILKAGHHSGSFFHINLLQEYLPLVAEMTWPNPEDERINLPGTISEKNWSYRFRPSVEEIVSNPDLKRVMAEVLSNDFDYSS